MGVAIDGGLKVMALPFIFRIPENKLSESLTVIGASNFVMVLVAESESFMLAVLLILKRKKFQGLVPPIEVRPVPLIPTDPESLLNVPLLVSKVPLIIIELLNALNIPALVKVVEAPFNVMKLEAPTFQFDAPL